ncbi:flagellar biosynthetic protein FliO [Ectothiorhodospira magna]|nr:flagellar biosynthetic protein FliO [Ectothiorhodospira magna]
MSTAASGAATDSAAYLGQMILGLTLVIALILVLGFLLRRMGGIQSGAAGELKVLGAVSLGARERMVLVQAGKTQLLLGVAPGRVQTLHVMAEPIESGTGTAPTTGAFAQRLRQAMGRRGETP